MMCGTNFPTKVIGHIDYGVLCRREKIEPKIPEFPVWGNVSAPFVNYKYKNILLFEEHYLKV